MERIIFTEDDIRRILNRLAHQVFEKNPNLKDVVLIGIQTRGAYLTKRFQAIMKEISSVDIPLGIIDITLYRDDLTTIGPNPMVKETQIDFDLNDKIVILIDDVLFTGRTVRAALAEIIDFGRPKKIELLVLIDRGHRELPIRADYVGKDIPTRIEELVVLSLKEIDNKDEVIIKDRENS